MNLINPPPEKLNSDWVSASLVFPEKTTVDTSPPQTVKTCNTFWAAKLDNSYYPRETPNISHNNKSNDGWLDVTQKN